MCQPIEMLERLRGNLADFNEIFFQNVYTRSDGPITGHVLVKILDFWEKISSNLPFFFATALRVAGCFIRPSLVVDSHDCNVLWLAYCCESSDARSLSHAPIP